MKLRRRAAKTLLLAILSVTTPHAVGHATFSNRAGQDKQIERISAERLKSKLATHELVTILDARSTESYEASNSRIRGSIHVKLRRLSFRLSLPPLNSVSRDSEVVIYCACPKDESSLRAAQILLDAGFKHVLVLEGGWQMWQRVNGPVEPRPKA